MYPLPKEGKKIIKILESAGFQAFFVGGCVRDLVLGKRPSDWDICTNAVPEEILRCFYSFRCIPTGLSHGTITVISGGIPFEVTTFRTEGAYLDHRRPSHVTFVTSLQQDLLRRDFTINTLVLHPALGILDLCGGMEDIRRKRIRCVGDPVTRFMEDPLRVMRALRFASVLGFAIEKRTASALRSQKGGLVHIAPQRIAGECNKLLLGDFCFSSLTMYGDVFSAAVPEIRPSIGFAQNSPYHCRDVWEHCCFAAASAPKELSVRLALLLHDLGKPACSSVDQRGVQHFYGHEKESEALAHDILNRLHYPKETCRQVLPMIRCHGALLSNEKEIRRMLNRIGSPLFEKLLTVKACDIKALSPRFIPEKEKALSQTRQLYQKILEQNQCFSRTQMQINGRDLMEIGIPPGKNMGQILNVLMEMILDGRIKNEREILLSTARQQFKGESSIR